MKYTPFRMERWQSTFENRVAINLSESGVHPMTVAELLQLAGREEGIDDIRLGYGQSNGSDGLRDRIAALYPGATEASVLVTVGGAEANFVGQWHLLDSGRPAAVMLPNYMQVPGMVENFGAPILPFHLREETGWQPDLDELRDALKAGANFILVTNPNNPTGACLTRGLRGRHRGPGRSIRGLDPVRRGLLWGRGVGGRDALVLGTDGPSPDNQLPLQGLRPSRASSGLGGGPGGPGPGPLGSNRLHHHFAGVSLRSSGHHRPGAHYPSKILERTGGIIRENFGAMKEWIEDQEGLFSYQPPDAGAICYMRYRSEVNSSEFAEKLRSEKDLLVVPGDHFGMDRYLQDRIRESQDELLEGLGRISEAFGEI